MKKCLKLILDTNIILKALIKNSKVRAILLSPNYQLYVPAYAVEEVKKHVPLLIEKTGLSEEKIKLALGILLTNIQVVPPENISTKWNEAEEIMGPIDRGDVPFIAAALSIAWDGIWSDDRDLKRQKRVKVWSTREIMGPGA